MKYSDRSARLAFVVHVESPRAAAADVARIEHVIHLFRGHHLPATWTASSCHSWQSMRHHGLLESSDEIAIAINHRESRSDFRDSFRKQLGAIENCLGSEIRLVAGEPADLRHHAAILADQGIQGVISNQVKSVSTPCHSPLPCGLWQLDFATSIPHGSWMSRILGGSVWSRISKIIAKEPTVIVSVDATRMAHASTRGLQGLERLLGQVSHVASQRELRITTAGEIAAELAASRVSRPQHSILRAA